MYLLTIIILSYFDSFASMFYKSLLHKKFDRKPLKERLPVALGFLEAVSLPFVIGLIYLYTNK